MLRDLFYRLFKRSKIQSFETRISELEHICAKLSHMCIESLEKTKDNYDLYLESKEQIDEMKEKMIVLYDYLIEEKWDTKH